MASSSSDDSAPLIARLQKACAGFEAENSDDDASPVPDWIQDTQTPTKIDLTRDSSDDDLVDGAKPGTEVAEPAPKPHTKAPGKTSTKGSAGVLPPGTGRRIPIMIPKNLHIDNGCFVRFSAEDPDSIDVSGDTAVLGRILAEAGTDGETLIDWKGKIFRAAEVPLAGTLMQVLVQPEAAKVEAVSNHLVHAIQIDGENEGPALQLSDSDDGYMSDQPVRKRDAKEGAAEEDEAAAKRSKKAVAKRSKKALKAGAAANPGTAKKGKAGAKKKKATKATKK